MQVSDMAVFLLPSNSSPKLNGFPSWKLTSLSAYCATARALGVRLRREGQGEAVRSQNDNMVGRPTGRFVCMCQSWAGATVIINNSLIPMTPQPEKEGINANTLPTSMRHYCPSPQHHFQITVIRSSIPAVVVSQRKAAPKQEVA